LAPHVGEKLGVGRQGADLVGVAHHGQDAFSISARRVSSSESKLTSIVLIFPAMPSID
jgi:hypothetical protein